MRLFDESERHLDVGRIVLTYLAAAIFLLLAARPVSGATISVTNLNDSGPGSLRQAITDAMASPSADTITFSISGTMTPLTALPNITADGGALSIDGTGQTVVISGPNAGRAFTVLSGATLSLQGLTLSNFSHSAILNAGSLTVSQCALTGNSSTAGGAIFTQGSLTLSGSTLSGNSATAGGGIYVSAPAIVSITDSIIANNTASDRGGGVFVASVLELIGSSITSNTAVNAGGGVYVENGSALTVAQSEVSGNSVPYGCGGGIFSLWALTVLNSTISSNQTPVCGGAGLAVYPGGDTLLLNATIANNSSLSQTAANIDVLGPGAKVTALNTIVAGPGGQTNCAVQGGAQIISNGHNLDSGNTCGFNVSGDIINTDPLLAPLGAYGGNTRTHALLNGSPAIEAGGLANYTAIDQRGRPRPQGSSYDIGAYEAATHAIQTFLGANGSSISCAPYDSMTGGSNPIYYIVEQSDPICAITPSIGYHVADVLAGPFGLPVSVGPLYTYGFANIQGNKSIQASFAANSNSIWLFKGPGLPNNSSMTSINAAFTQAAADNDDEIRVHSGAYLEGFGAACSGDFGGLIPMLSGGWASVLGKDTKPTVIAPKLTISGSCALEIDEITIQ